MAGFSFLGSMLPTALSAVNAVNSARRQTQSYKVAQETYQIKQQELANNLATQDKQNQIAAEKDATERRDALRRAIARQRAQFGGQGIDSSDGSAEAILLGLTQQSEDEQRQQSALDQLRSQALRDQATTQSRKNLLELNKAYDNLRLSSLYVD